MGSPFRGHMGLSLPYPGLQEQTPGSRQEPWQEAGQLGWLQNIPVRGGRGHLSLAEAGTADIYFSPFKGSG
jgi:hypothetical protein